MFTIIRLVVRPVIRTLTFAVIVGLVKVSFAAEIPTSPVQPVLLDGGNGMVPLDINDNGEVVGVYDFGPLIQHGFFWSPTRGFVDLGVLDAGGQSHAEAINNCGVIVGWATDAVGTFESLKAVRWSAALVIADFSPTTGPMVLRDINDRGHVVGAINAGGFFWSASTGTIDIGGIGGTFTDPMALNDDDEIGGTAYNTDFINHAFRWSQAEGMTDLNPPGSQSSDGLGIDAKGDVVGTFNPPTGGLHAAKFRHNGQVVDLNPMGPTDVDFPSAALDIAGKYVVGVMLFPGGVLGERAFVIKGNKVQLLSMSRDDVFETRARAVNRKGQVAGNVSFTDGTSSAAIWNLKNNSDHTDAQGGAKPCSRR